MSAISDRTSVQTLSRVLRSPTGVFGLTVSVLLVLIAIYPYFTVHDYASVEVSRRLSGPSGTHPLGTDHLGRDLLARLLFGARVALIVAVPAVAGAVVVGGLMGVFAGYRGGRIDNVLVVAMDAMQAFPAIILALALLAVLGPSIRNVIAAIIVALAPQYARLTRALVLKLRQEPYIRSEQALGASHLRVIVRHILPNMFPPVVILASIDLAAAVTIEAGLSFLGIGVQAPTPSWGVMLAEGFGRVRDAPWPVVWPGLALIVTTLSLTMLGESLRDALDVKMDRSPSSGPAELTNE